MRTLRPATLTTFCLLLTGLPAQDTVPGVRISGPVEAHWVSSGSTMPLAKGTFSLRRAEGASHCAIELAATGRLAWGEDAEGAWLIDPVAGPRLLEHDEFAGWRLVTAVIAGQARAPTVPDGAKAVRVNDRDVLAFKKPSPHGGEDEWVVAKDGGHLVRARIRVVSGLGQVRSAELSVFSATRLKNAEIPSAFALRLTEFEHVLRLEKVDRKARLTPADLRLDPATRAAAGSTESGTPAMRRIEIAPMATATIRRKVGLQDMGKALGSMLPEVHGEVRRQKVRMLAAPFARYHSFGTEIDLEAGVAVARAIEAAGRVKPGKLPGGTVLTTWHVGPYHELGAAHARAVRYIAEHGLKTSGPPWEIYWTDPGLVSDPAQWRTQLFFPIEK